MDRNCFARITHVFAAIPSRREALRGLAAAGLTLGMARLPVGAEARRKRKRKRNKRKERPAKPNAYGCLEVGDPCQRADQCCSGICEGAKGRKRCQAHHTGTCPQDIPGRCLAPGSVSTCNANLACSCFRTTAGSVACLDVARHDLSCADCRTDADCVAFGMPEGSACIPAAAGPCTIYCGGGPACLAPCPSPPPEA